MAPQWAGLRAAVLPLLLAALPPASARSGHLRPWGRLGPLQPVPTYPPTPQPATRGQDEQECGWLALPENIFMSPRISDGFAVSGDIESDTGAIFCTWTQDLFAWEYETVYFNVDTKLFVKAERVDEEDELPVEERVKIPYGWNAYVFKDCTGVVLYIVREEKKWPHRVTVSNRADQLVAYSEKAGYFKDQLHFYDDLHAPIAIAQSPMIVEGNPGFIRNGAEDAMGGIPTWEVMFVSGYGSNSSLILAQNRWVVALAVQYRAIRGASRAKDGSVLPSALRVLSIGVSVAFFVALVLAFFALLVWVYRLVHPPSYPEIENEYLQPKFLRSSGQRGTSVPEGGLLPTLQPVPARTL